jgi:hypothetical protein
MLAILIDLSDLPANASRNLSFASGWRWSSLVAMAK